MGKLTVRRVQTAKGPAALVDGGGLRLKIKASGKRSWVWRGSRHGLQYEIGLGAFPDVSLQEARQLAADLRRQLAAGIRPELPKPEITGDAQPLPRMPSFAEYAAELIEIKRPEWKSPKHAQQWQNTLARYAFPVLGRMSIAEIEPEHVLQALRPIWHAKPETASRVRARIEAVIDLGRMREKIRIENPARWKGNLELELAKSSKIKTVEHFKALPFEEIPTLWRALTASAASSVLCLRWLLLIACRSGEARHATWAEIDLRRKIWTIPASRTKTRAEHVQPLSHAALELLQLAKIAAAGSELIFPAPRGGALTDVAVAKSLRRYAGRNDVTVHGTCRSGFKDWALERRASVPDFVSEMCLGHRVGDATRRAYARSDLQELRRDLLNDWADFVTGGAE